MDPFLKKNLVEGIPESRRNRFCIFFHLIIPVGFQVARGHSSPLQALDSRIPRNVVWVSTLSPQLLNSEISFS